MRPLSLLSLLILVLAAHPVKAQVVTRHISTRDGLLDNSVTTMVRDSRGVIWAGTQNGVVLLDGRQVRPIGATIGMDVSALQATSEGVWLGTASGEIVLLDLYTQTIRQRMDVGGEVRDLDHDGDRLLVATSGGVSSVPVAGGPAEEFYDEGTNALWIGDSGQLWLGTDSGFGPLDESGEWTDLSGSDSLRVSVLRGDPNGLSVWVGTVGQGLHHVGISGNPLGHYSQARGDAATIGSDYVYDVLPLVDRVWVATIWSDGDAGLSVLNTANGSFRRYHYNPEDPLSVNSFGVLSLARSTENAILAGTLYGGISVVEPEHPPGRFIRPRALDSKGLLNHMDVGFAVAGAQGDLWVGYLGYGLDRYSAAGDSAPSPPVTYGPEPDAGQSLGASYVIDGALDEEGVLWIGSWSGLYRVGPEGPGVQVRLMQSGQREPRVFAVLPTSDAVWAGGQGNRVYRYDRVSERAEAYLLPVPQDASANSRTESFTLSDDGRLWTVSGGALYVFDGDEFVRVETPGMEERARFAAAAGDGTLWIGTQFNGLLSLDPGVAVLDRIGVARGLRHGAVTGMVLDGSILWVATDQGLHRVDTGSGRVLSLPESADVQANKFRQSKVTVDAAGVVRMAGLNGVYALDTHGLVLPNPVTGPALVSVAGGEMNGPNVVSASWRSREGLRLSFAVPSFSGQPIRYRYRLGDASEWRPAPENGAIDLSAAGSGSHRIEVAAEVAGAVSPATALTVEVGWPWWRHPAMLLFWVLLTMAGSVVWVQRRLVEAGRREAVLQAAVDERTNALRARNQELESANATIQGQAQRLTTLDAMKSRFFANISHEFRTPLALILGPVQDALNGRWGDLTNDETADLSMMRRQGHRLLTLVNQMLDLATLDAGRLVLEREPIDLVALSRTTVQAFSSFAERKGVTLRFSAKRDVVRTELDPGRMEQILNNLIGNALKFTPDGGTVSVTLSSKDGTSALAVRDTGPGISQEDQALLFDRFYSSDRHGRVDLPGTGIGLALTRELVGLHGGRIAVESEPGFGATFLVTVPTPLTTRQPDLTRSPSVDAAYWSEGSGERELPEPSGSEPGSPLILVVEDNPDISGYIARALSGHYRIAIESDGVQGLARARRDKPALVISDVMMPEMDGIALCQAIKSDDEISTTPVVLLTARADEESKMEGLGAGADDYLYKPFNTDELRVRAENLIMVRRLMQKAYSDGRIAVRVTDVDVPSEDQLLVEQAQAVVERHIGDTQFSATWLADEIGISARHLQRRLSAATGLTPVPSSGRCVFSVPEGCWSRERAMSRRWPTRWAMLIRNTSRGRFARCLE